MGGERPARRDGQGRYLCGAMGGHLRGAGGAMDGETPARRDGWGET